MTLNLRNTIEKMNSYEDLGFQNDRHEYMEPHLYLEPIGNRSQSTKSETVLKTTSNTNKYKTTNKINASSVKWYIIFCVILLVLTNAITFLATYLSIEKDDRIQDCSLQRDICTENVGFNYEPDIGLCYKYLPTTMLYEEAVKECTSLNAELIKVDSGLVQIILEHFLDSVTNGEVRIQGMRKNATAIWQYNDGSEMKYFNWNKNQPEERDSEAYIIIRKSSQYAWHDTFYNEKYAVICQIT